MTILLLVSLVLGDGSEWSGRQWQRTMAECKQSQQNVERREGTRATCIVLPSPIVK